MPRLSSAAQEITAFAVPVQPMPPPGELDAEAAGFWRELVGSSPAERFGQDARPLLVELMRAMTVARRVAHELDRLRGRSLTSDTKAGAATRRVFLQLAAAARDQSRLIAALSVKLRFAEQTKTRKAVAESERRSTPSGPRPWDVERHN
jgi:hypothetical protein